MTQRLFVSCTRLKTDLSQTACELIRANSWAIPCARISLTVDEMVSLYGNIASLVAAHYVTSARPAGMCQASMSRSFTERVTAVSYQGEVKADAARLARLKELAKSTGSAEKFRYFVELTQRFR